MSVHLPCGPLLNPDLGYPRKTDLTSSCSSPCPFITAGPTASIRQLNALRLQRLDAIAESRESSHPTNTHWPADDNDRFMQSCVVSDLACEFHPRNGNECIRLTVHNIGELCFLYLRNAAQPMSAPALCRTNAPAWTSQMTFRLQRNWSDRLH